MRAYQWTVLLAGMPLWLLTGCGSAGAPVVETTEKAGCHYDAQCKGDRLCVAQVCVSPQYAAAYEEKMMKEGGVAPEAAPIAIPPAPEVAVHSTVGPAVDEKPAPVEKWDADSSSTDKPVSLYTPPPSQIQMQCSPMEIARCMKQCEEGDAVYCYAAAKAQENLPGASQNGEQILLAYTRACEGGFGAACVNIARMHFTGQHVKKSEATAFSMNKEACAKNDMYGCANAGLMAERGVGTKKSMSVSHEYRTKACSLGHADSCAAVEAAEQRMKEADAAAEWY